MQIPSEELDPVLKRLRRAQGQLAAVIRMIEDERDCGDVVTQLAACTKAIDRAGVTYVTTGLHTCLASNRPDRDADLAVVEKLFLSFA